jgi:hypothetical protein
MQDKKEVEEILGYAIPENYNDNQIEEIAWRGIKAKMRIESIKNFTEEEINRVFDNVAAPVYCKKQVKKMIAKGLTIEALYAEVK